MVFGFLIENFFSGGLEEYVDQETLRRVRLVNWAGLFLVTLPALWAFSFFSYHAWGVGLVYLFISPLSGALMLVLRKTHRALPIGHVFAGLGLLLVTLSNWYSGGLSGANSAVFLIAPVAALAMLGKHGLWWVLVSFLVFVGFGILQLNGFGFQNVIPQAQRALDSVLTFMTAFVVVIGMVFSFERARLRNERQLKRALEAAEAASRAKSAFVANISHEIRTPVHGLLGMLALMEHERDSKLRRELAENARQSGRILINVVDELLSLAKMEAEALKLEPAPVDVARMLAMAIEVVSSQAARKGIELESSIAEGVPPIVLADPVRLRQILINLAGNAVKFTQQGKIRIAVERTGQLAAGQRVRLRFSVSDTGIGIPSHDSENIFEPFFQVDGSSTRSYGGTGLGLAICKRLVEFMGGRIGVESREGEGSRFWFALDLELPRDKQAPEAQPEELAGEDASPPALSKSVLLVEDNPLNRKVAQAFLQKLGYLVETAGNGREALDKFLAARYDAVLMDLHLPVMDGYETTRCIRAHEKQDSLGGPAVPIIALTASASEDERRACLEAGLNDFLSKPYSKRDLETVLGRNVDPGNG